MHLSQQLGGALALISGRPLLEIDHLFTPYEFAAAGVHGCELRALGLSTRAIRVDRQLVAAIHERCRGLAQCSPSILVEYKTYGAAIHYRLAPGDEPRVAAFASQLLQDIGPEFELQLGKYVYELKPAGISKGTAIRTFMSCEPFIGRRPLFIGDDATDEHAFEAVNGLAGMSIKVGYEGHSIALSRIADPVQVHHLLALLCDFGAAALTGAPD